MKKNIRNAGFTLIELVTVIAILAILSSISLPLMQNLLDDARDAQCTTNRYKVSRSYQIYKYSNEMTNINDVIANNDNQYFSNDLECSVGGVYSAKIINGRLAVVCSVHGDIVYVDSEEHKSVGMIVAKDMIDLLTKLKGMTTQEQQEYIGSNSLSNSKFRSWLLNNVYDGQWQILDSEFVQKNGLSETTLYVQPYITPSTNDPKDVIVYASTNPGDNWNTHFIYNLDDDMWYQAPKNQWNNFENIMLAGKTWDDVKNEIQLKGWTLMEQ